LTSVNDNVFALRCITTDDDKDPCDDDDDDGMASIRSVSADKLFFERQARKIFYIRGGQAPKWAWSRRGCLQFELLCMPNGCTDTDTLTHTYRPTSS